MSLRLRTRLRHTLGFDQFELRLALSASPTSLTIPLDPTFDQFGAQIETIQAYGDPAQATFGIFDTGASVITVSADDRASLDYYGASIPVKVPGGALAEGIGGGVVGDVSAPGTIWADGIHASSLSFDDYGFPSFEVSFGPDSAQAPGVQVFLGTDSGSPSLPTVTGTPILNPSPEHPSGLAALVDLQGYQLDFSDIFPGLVLAQPDLHFVSPATTLAASSETTAPVRIPVSFVGADNHSEPGDLITESQNPVVQGVSLVGSTTTVDQQTFLFDTGAQLTVLSTAEALALGLDLANPDSTITVQGVGGTEDVPGFTLPALTIPLDDGGTLQFTNVPVYVLDAAPGLVDGILGMNLLNTAAQALYNPFDSSGPSLSLTFSTNPDRDLGGGFSFFSLFAGQGRALLGADSANSNAGAEAVASTELEPRLQAAIADAAGPVLVFVPGEAGSGFDQPSVDSRSGPTPAAAATPQGPSAVSARPAQAVASRPVGVATEDLVLEFEDPTFETPVLRIGSTPLLDPEISMVALPDGPNPVVPAAAQLSRLAYDYCLAEVGSGVDRLTDSVAQSAVTLAEGAASLEVLPAATAAGFAAVLASSGYWATPTVELVDSSRRRRSSIRIVLDQI